MQDINTIYHNYFGVAFQWKKDVLAAGNKIQIIFRDTGLLLSYAELKQFSKNIIATRKSNTPCADCALNDSCKALLVDSPAPQITFAMNVEELNAIQDLVEGTLFQLDLKHYLGICDN